MSHIGQSETAIVCKVSHFALVSYVTLLMRPVLQVSINQHIFACACFSSVVVSRTGFMNEVAEAYLLPWKPIFMAHQGTTLLKSIVSALQN